MGVHEAEQQQKCYRVNLCVRNKSTQYVLRNVLSTIRQSTWNLCSDSSLRQWAARKVTTSRVSNWLMPESIEKNCRGHVPPYKLLWSLVMKVAASWISEEVNPIQSQAYRAFSNLDRMAMGSPNRCARWINCLNDFRNGVNSCISMHCTSLRGVQVLSPSERGPEVPLSRSS